MRLPFATPVCRRAHPAATGRLVTDAPGRSAAGFFRLLSLLSGWGPAPSRQDGRAPSGEDPWDDSRGPTILELP
jgi:hypothetical protein